MSKKPGHCPGCGAALIGETAAVAILDDSSGERGWDCFCAGCGWSGDVWPDGERGTTGDAGSPSPRRAGGRRP